MLDRKFLVRIGAAMLGTGIVATSISPARAETTYVSPVKAAIVARDTAVRTDGQAAVVEAMLARVAISGVYQPIIFDDALGPKVAAWLVAHGSPDFLATPVDISGNRFAVAFYDPSTRGLDPYQRVAAVMKHHQGEYIDGMGVDVATYRAGGLPKPTFQKLEADQLLEVEHFAVAVHEHHSSSTEHSDVDRAEKSMAAGVIQAARNIYYGQSAQSATRNGVSNVINKAINDTIKGLRR